jgi:hypothetical protein
MGARGTRKRNYRGRNERRKVGSHYGIYGSEWERWSQNGNHGIKGWEER